MSASLFSAGDTGDRLGRSGPGNVAPIKAIEDVVLSASSWYYNVFYSTTKGWLGCGSSKFFEGTQDGYSKIPALEGIEPKWFAAGHYNLVVIKSDGSVIESDRESGQFSPIKPDFKAQYVSTGKFNAILIPSDSGGLYYTKCMSKGSYTLIAPEITFVDCAAGWSPSSDERCHFVALSADGDVYTFGQGHACGQGSNFNKYNQITKVLLPSITISRVFAFSDNSYLLDSDNHIWSCGRNEYGQLGHGDTSSIDTFKMVANSPSDPIIQIDGGNGSIFILTNTGKLYSAGDGDYYQLAQDHRNSIKNFTLCKYFKEKNVTLISPGLFHVIIGVDYENVWYYRTLPARTNRHRQLVYYE